MEEKLREKRDSNVKKNWGGIITIILTTVMELFFYIWGNITGYKKGHIEGELSAMDVISGELEQKANKTEADSNANDAEEA